MSLIMCDVCISPNPISNYQTQQRIWNTVRVDSSQYLLNKGALTAYKPVIWNQKSDRPLPHIQQSIPSRGNSTKTTLTRARPGACSPGGVGCDVKHDSYARYLNRIKGRALKGRNEGGDIPVYGRKYYATHIIPSCRCEINEIVEPIVNIRIETEKDVELCIGEMVSWKKCNKKIFGEIVSILEDSLLVQQLDEYGEFKKLDVIKRSEIKKDCTTFLTKEKLSTEYFEKSFNLFS
jgi:hypothetical protein